jgi:phytoene desaturase
VGERLSDRIDLMPVAPAYRASFADGSALRVFSDRDAMAAEVERFAGSAQADGYLRLRDWLTRLYRVEFDGFIAANFDSPLSLVTPQLARLAAIGGFRRWDRMVRRYITDERLSRVFTFQALYAGVPPQRAVAVYAVIAYMDTVAGVYFPRGGIHAVPRALAAVAEKYGVTIRYDTTVTRVETSGGRARGVAVEGGDLVPADVVILNPDLPVAYRDLLPGRSAPRLRYSPSCVVLHVGSTQGYERIAHHNIHFGRAWKSTFDEVIRRGRLMSDPSLLVTNPSRTDPSLAPEDRHTYYVLAPTPNLATPTIDWRGPASALYRTDLVETLEQRGYLGFGAGIETARLVTPADWADAGMAAGTPFAAAHTLRQTGPFRPGNLHPTLPNVVFVGSGTQPGVGVPMVLISGRLAAQRVTGANA